MEYNTEEGTYSGEVIEVEIIYLITGTEFISLNAVSHIICVFGFKKISATGKAKQKR